MGLLALLEQTLLFRGRLALKGFKDPQEPLATQEQTLRFLVLLALRVLQGLQGQLGLPQLLLVLQEPLEIQGLRDFKVLKDLLGLKETSVLLALLDQLVQQATLGFKVRLG